MNKAIVFVRASTFKQEIESQIEETKALALQNGYKESELIVIGASGASAVKVNDLYLEKIHEMFRAIENDKDIKAVFVWHLNRLARNEQMAFMVKDFLVKHGIQLYIREPSLRLLDDDGRVNAGAELCFSIFATMSRQQAVELEEKSRRGKALNISNGKWTGGKNVLFGYYRDEKNYLHVDPDTSKIVVEVFSMYATGLHSYSTIQKEINERYGIGVSSQWVRQKIGNRKYLGGCEYKQIIGEDLFNKCQAIANGRTNRKSASVSNRTFCNVILRCSKCGYGYTNTTSKDEQVYRCSHCHHGEFISVANLDGLVWEICKHLEGNRLVKTDTTKELRENKAALEAKVKSADKVLAKYKKSVERLKEAYLGGVIDMGEYKKRTAKIDKDSKAYLDSVAEWRTDIARIDDVINKQGRAMHRILNAANIIFERDEVKMRSIVRYWVKKITLVEHIVTVETIAGSFKAKYMPKSNTRRWTDLSGNTLPIKPIIRNGNECSFGDGLFKVEDIPNLGEWLRNRE